MIVAAGPVVVGISLLPNWIAVGWVVEYVMGSYPTENFCCFWKTCFSAAPMAL